MRGLSNVILKSFDLMNVPPLCFCAKFRSKNSSLGYKTHWWRLRLLLMGCFDDDDDNYYYYYHQQYKYKQFVYN